MVIGTDSSISIDGMDSNVLAFDIETIPDVDGIRRLNEHANPSMSDADVAELAFAERREKTGSDFLPHHLHKICAIAVVLRNAHSLRVWSLGEKDASEVELIRRFFDGLERFKPTLVSWNGGGFDLPVLHYRAMVHGVPAPSYWETGNEITSFRFNNYLSRFHYRHTDLMDVLSGYQARATCGLDSMAVLCGFPGKLGMSGDKVWPAYLAGELSTIRDYCETDALNTFLLYLRFELIRGRLQADQFDIECERVQQVLEEDGRAHLIEFARAWEAARLSAPSAQSAYAGQFEEGADCEPR